MASDYRFSPVRKEKVGVDATTVVLPTPSEAKVVRRVPSRRFDPTSKSAVPFPSKPIPLRRTASFEAASRRPSVESDPFLPYDPYPSTNYEEIEALKPSPEDLDDFVTSFTESYLESHDVHRAPPAASLDAWRSFEASSTQCFPHHFPRRPR